MSDTERTKPEIDFPEGPAPDKLEIEDLIVGDGDEAAASSTVKVHYLGVDYESGDEFDSSWSRGEPIEFPLSALVKGWQEGIPGMRVGGRRKLVLPPALAYGTSGGHPLAGRTLVFVIDLLGVR
ncbi:peptidyl-prolyl cis-trans isomerase [Pseudoclavibacter endophyticus]|uniref:Peptidyl-prolyl cis-trans isomerase n=1 Tax=Pseudoclavibacter endophyticus TaxID=1778590 RepID=A0A6H9WTB4_9MICO|nr:FKBP-type peptidyl-prolyl cis-trans isomerase [Pseudoclavibacter endophyticus]KAB1649925.1 FKBP-type peptidyl-prolyl cis-trans isomerase [Pseudoclavibacter endophyticus]GGA58677.1 peptidyl-prolyl cis-trans isomerase [Pseudoclavibacter endophyticus]